MLTSKQIGKHDTLQGLSLALVLLFLSCAVQAQDLSREQNVLNVPEVVTDAELSEMRGRYISQGRPIYFGIYMQSQWSTAGGGIINAGMTIGMNLRKDITNGNGISIGVHMEDAVETAGEIDNNAVAVAPASDVNIGGLDSAQGVVQAITVSGDDNQAHNKTTMTLQTVPPEQAESKQPGSQTFYFGGQNLSTSPVTTTDITGTTSQVNSDGVVTTAFVDENGVGIKIDVPEQGSAMQLLRGKNDTREGSVFFQTIQIDGGNGNSVTNRLSFIAEFSAINGGNQINSIQPALDSLKAIQGIGIQ